ncbi:MAG: thiamine phosphate synthase [Myxococcaceae bacterium]|nr:thiamine phosphate synthase [Myxococcaceae bacterium]
MAVELILITDWSLPDLLDRLAAALTAGPGIAIQHRHPEATGRQFFDEAVKLRERFPSTPLFVNRRLDVALALGAWLHLPAYGLWPEDVRGRVERVSVAVHSLEEAARAGGADLALVSPVFVKGDAVPLGVDGFQRIAAALPCPAFALGGVTARVPGAAGHAVISSVLRAADPAAAAKVMLRP